MARVESQRRGANRGGGPPSWLIGLGALILGLVLGLVYGWVIDPVDVTGTASPSELAAGGQENWIDMTADSLALTGDQEQARRRLSVFPPDRVPVLLGERLAVAQGAGDLAREQRLEQLAQLVAAPVVPPTTPDEAAVPPPAASNTLRNVLWTCAGLLVALLLIGGFAIVMTRARQPAPARSRTPTTRNRAQLGGATERPRARDRLSLPMRGTPTERAEALAEADADADEDDMDRLLADTADAVDEAADEPARTVDFAPTAPAERRYSPALDEFVTRYNFGDDGYDMSFSIETQAAEFLGECGVGISDVVNNGSPQQVTAFEVWLFDKDDIRTVTKVLLSDYAWNDEEVRSRLAPKGELIHVRAGDTLDLETKSLRVRARVREVDYGDGGPGPRSYFEKLVVELTPQHKQ